MTFGRGKKDLILFTLFLGLVFVTFIKIWSKKLIEKKGKMITI